jgi:hypothetical protein
VNSVLRASRKSMRFGNQKSYPSISHDHDKNIKQSFSPQSQSQSMEK